MADNEIEFARPELQHLRSAHYATKPTRWTRFTRVFWPWQIVRFLVINLKMMLILSKGHGGRR